MIDKKAVGERIKAIRLSLGMTLKEFGELFDSTKATVHNWETGRNLPNRKNTSDIAFYGQISVDELLYNRDTNTLIMNEFIKFVDDSLFEEADIAFSNGENHFCGSKHVFAKELAENFIIKIGGN